MPQTPNPDRPTASRFILLGEDDPDDQHLLKEVFLKIDDSFVLFFVDRGEEVLGALETLAEDRPPCLIILDYNMPGLNGAEILKVLNADPRYQGIPKIIWSTSGSEKYKNSCLALGAADYVIKPSSAKELEEIARYMLSHCAV